MGDRFNEFMDGLPSWMAWTIVFTLAVVGALAVGLGLAYAVRLIVGI